MCLNSGENDKGQFLKKNLEGGKWQRGKWQRGENDRGYYGNLNVLFIIAKFFWILGMLKLINSFAIKYI